MTVHPDHAISPEQAAEAIAAETPPPAQPLPAETPAETPAEKEADNGFADVTRALSMASDKLTSAADRIAVAAEKNSPPQVDTEMEELVAILRDPEATPREITMAKSAIRVLDGQRRIEADSVAAKESAAEQRIDKQEADLRADYPGLTDAEINRAYALWDDAIKKDPAMSVLNLEEVVGRTFGWRTLEARRSTSTPKPPTGLPRPGAPPGRIITDAALGAGVETGPPWQPSPGATLKDAEKAAIAAMGYART